MINNDYYDVTVKLLECRVSGVFTLCDTPGHTDRFYYLVSLLVKLFICTCIVNKIKIL